VKCVRKNLYMAGFRRLKRCYISMLIVAEMIAIGSTLPAQSLPGTLIKKSDAKTYSQAYVDFLLGRELAADNSRPEALQKLAESLRLQPQNNPASGLVFQLLADQRARTRIVFRGHRGPINFVTYSPDGSKVVTVSDDFTARLWDAHTGQQLFSPLQHEGPVFTASFSADGKRLATGSKDETVRVWDVNTGQPIGSPLKATGAVLNVHFSPDGKVVGAGTDDGKAFFWNVDSGQLHMKPVQYHEAVNSIRFSRDGSRILIGSGDGIADVLDAKSGARLMKPLLHGNIVFTADFGPDDKTIVTASADFTARIWDAKTGRPVIPLIHHHGSIRSAVLSEDGSRVATASRDHTARVWNAQTGQPVTPPLQHGDSVFNALFSPDGNFVLTSAADHTVRLWDANSGEPLRTPIHSQKTVSVIAFNPNGSSFIASQDNILEIFDLPPQQAPPAWVVEVADFAATQNHYNQVIAPDFTQMNAVRSQILASKTDDSWTKFGRWYFADGAERPISPWSSVSLKQYVDTLIEEGEKDSLDYAAAISYDHPDWLQKISVSRTKLKDDASNNMAPSK
jgi:WD40 repeat protein